jgi:hypothetical protein
MWSPLHPPPLLVGGELPNLSPLDVVWVGHNPHPLRVHPPIEEGGEFALMHLLLIEGDALPIHVASTCVHEWRPKTFLVD